MSRRWASAGSRIDYSYKIFEKKKEAGRPEFREKIFHRLEWDEQAGDAASKILSAYCMLITSYVWLGVVLEEKQHPHEEKRMRKFIKYREAMWEWTCSVGGGWGSVCRWPWYFLQKFEQEVWVGLVSWEMWKSLWVVLSTEIECFYSHGHQQSTKVLNVAMWVDRNAMKARILFYTILFLPCIVVIFNFWVKYFSSTVIQNWVFWEW